MISFARNVTDSVKSHTPQLKALHSKSTPPHLTASGIRSVARNDIHVIKSEQNSGGHASIEVHPSYSVLTIFLTPIFFEVSKNRPSGEYPDVLDLCETQRITSNQACKGRICTS